MEMNENNQSWFLETSIFINRFFGHSLLKKNIKSTIGTIPSYTSYFVLYEFKRCVIQTLINLYFTVLEEDTPSDAFAYYMTNFRDRENKIILGAIGSLIYESDLSKNKSKLLSTIETLIYSSLQEFNDSITDYIENRSKCPLAKISLKNSFEEFREKITCRTECNIANFWKINRKILIRLTNESNINSYMENKQFSNQVPILREILDNFQRGQMVKNCQRIADTIIAIEMPKNHTMLTYDRSFEGLCPLLNKEVHRLPSLQELKRGS